VKSANEDIQSIAVSNENFYAIQWEKSKTICTVPQSAVFKSPEFTRVNDICFVEIERQYRKGQILHIGK
jgi:hypothetical protein